MSSEIENLLDQQKINSWILSSLMSYYKLKPYDKDWQERAEHIVNDKAHNIHTRIIEDEKTGIQYVTMFCKKNTYIAQKPLYYFIKIEDANTNTETDSMNPVLSEWANDSDWPELVKPKTRRRSKKSEALVWSDWTWV